MPSPRIGSTRFRSAESFDKSTNDARFSPRDPDLSYAADDVQMNDPAPIRSVDHVHDPGGEGLLLVAGGHDRAGQDPVGFSGSVEEGLDVPRLVHLSDVGGKRGQRSRSVHQCSLPICCPVSSGST